MSDEETKTKEIPRKGIMALEIKVTYEDGWEQTMKSPPIIQYRQAGGPILTPTQERPIVKAINKDGIDKALLILQSVRDDVIGTMPSQEEIQKAQQAIAQQKADASSPPIVIPGQPPTPATS